MPSIVLGYRVHHDEQKRTVPSSWNFKSPKEQAVKKQVKNNYKMRNGVRGTNRMPR